MPPKTKSSSAELDAKADAMTAIVQGKAKVAKLRARHRRELADAESALARSVAQAASSTPASEQWWAHPGLLSVDEVLGALSSRAPAELDRQMRRYRASL